MLFLATGSNYSLFLIALMQQSSKNKLFMKIIIINGPNLNLLGKREPEIYGSNTFEDYFRQLQSEFEDIELAYFQSNIEGEIIDKIHETGFSYDGIILNAAAYTHTSVGIGDAVKGVETPVVEVHISNVYERESFRHTSYIAPNVKGIIAGFGLQSYELAIRSIIR
jgi:3-dehydroquinate dehydratase II